MKSGIFKRIMGPLAVMVLGIAGAFTTTSMSSTKALTAEQGYIFVSPVDRCHESIMCDTQEGDLCKLSDGTTQVWGKDTPSTCIKKLYKP